MGQTIDELLAPLFALEPFSIAARGDFAGSWDVDVTLARPQKRVSYDRSGSRSRCSLDLIQFQVSPRGFVRDGTGREAHFDPKPHPELYYAFEEGDWAVELPVDDWPGLADAFPYGVFLQLSGEKGEEAVVATVWGCEHLWRSDYYTIEEVCEVVAGPAMLGR